MAEFSTTSLNSFEFLLLKDDEKVEIVEAMGDVARDAIAAEGRAKGVYDSEQTQHVVDNIVRKKGKANDDGASCIVTVKGTQHGVRNAEIAFINEFGKTGQPARPFFRDGVEKKQDNIFNAGEKAYGKIIDKKENANGNI